MTFFILLLEKAGYTLAECCAVSIKSLQVFFKGSVRKSVSVHNPPERTMEIVEDLSFPTLLMWSDRGQRNYLTTHMSK